MSDYRNQRINPVIRKIIKRIADKHQLKPKEVEAIYLSGFHTVSEKVKMGETGDPLSFKFIPVPFFGKFVIKMGRVRYFHDSPDEEKIYPYAVKERKRFKKYYTDKEARKKEE